MLPSHSSSRDDEYRRLTNSAGVLVRDDRALIRVWGKDPVRMVNGLITNDLANAGAQRVVYGAMLTPKGRIVTDLRAFVLEDGGSTELMIDLPAAALEATRAHLGKYVPPLFARWAESESRCVGIYGPQSKRVVKRLLGEEPPGAGRVTRANRHESKVTIVASRVGTADGFDFLVPPDLLDELENELVASAEQLGGGRISSASLETLRIEGGAPRFGLDFTDESMPAEVFETTGRMKDAVSFTKGCYTGQEVVVRIAHRGHVNRHLRGLVFEGLLPEPGTRVHGADGRDIGWTTSSTRSPLMGAGIALAMLRREIEPGMEVRLGSPEGPVASVVTLPFRRAPETS